MPREVLRVKSAESCVLDVNPSWVTVELKVAN